MTAMTVDPRQIRSRTCGDFQRLGVPMNADRFPLIWQPDEDVTLRSVGEIEARAAILNVLQARVMDMPPQNAMRWMLDAHVLEEMTRDEWAFIGSGVGDPRRYAQQLDALYGLAWLLGLVEHLDPQADCAEGLAALFPDLRSGEPFGSWRARTLTTRPDAWEVASLLDMYYCLDWMYQDAARRGLPAPGPLDPAAVWHRRWALEWALVVRGRNQVPFPAWDQVDLSA